LVPMTTPGITVRPLVLMTGHHHFNEVFFTGVVVPKTSLLGPVNQGWKVATTTLMYERHSAGGRSHTAQITRLMALARQLSIDGRPAWAHPWIRQRLVQLAIASEALKYTRSEERRVGKEGRYRRSASCYNKEKTDNKSSERA